MARYAQKCAQIFQAVDVVPPSSLEKVPCGAFSDINSVATGKKRVFCRLRSIEQRKSDRLPIRADIGAFLNFRKVPSHRAGFS